MLRTLFKPSSCGNSQYTRNEPNILLANFTAGSEFVSFGSTCLLKGEYEMTFEIPQGSSSRGADAEMVADSVKFFFTLT